MEICCGVTRQEPAHPQWQQKQWSPSPVGEPRSHDWRRREGFGARRGL